MSNRIPTKPKHSLYGIFMTTIAINGQNIVINMFFVLPCFSIVFNCFASFCFILMPKRSKKGKTLHKNSGLHPYASLAPYEI